MINGSKIIITSVPWTDTASPLMAPAILKGSLKKYGIESLALDLNAEIRNWVLAHDQKDGLLKFMITGEIQRSARNAVKDFIDRMANRILEHRPDWVAISLLTYLSQNSGKWLCFRLKQLAPDIKIVAGGPGISVALKGTERWGESMHRQKLIDYWLAGDGEKSLPELLLGTIDPSKTNTPDWEQLEDLNALPLPDFDDYDWSLYSLKRVSIVGSRGCVRKCTFCDIHEHWSKYQWRSGENIFQEILHQKTKYGINIFSFNDSLINGNQQEYRTLIRLLSEHNTNHPDDKIKWAGSFIIRPKNQMKEIDWKMTADSGAVILNVGIESFVEHIRYHIGKKFTNDDLDFALEMALKYNIKFNLLMIVGYVTETQEDFDQALRWISDHKHLIDMPIDSVQIGSGLGILEGTWLDRNHNKLGIEIRDRTVTQDWVRKEINSTPELRMKWHQQIKDHLETNGYTVTYHIDNHMLIESRLYEKYRSS